MKRINKEKANIRKNFTDTKKKLSEYDKKKYVAKLMYIFMLGYDVDFGHTQAFNLLSSTEYSNKQIVSLEIVTYISTKKNSTFLFKKKGIPCSWVIASRTT